jgi:hypothetical protein
VNTQTLRNTLPRGLTDAAKAERRRFEETYRKTLEQANGISLSILVWGPKRSAKTAVAKKRKKIRSELLRKGHNAMFSEELPSLTDGVSEKAKEFAQAVAAHIIVVLIEGSPGAQGETHDFCNHPKLASKFYVLAPKEYRQGYSARGALAELDLSHGGVYWYDQEELEQCTVLGRVVQRAEALRQMIFRKDAW